MASKRMHAALKRDAVMAALIRAVGPRQIAEIPGQISPFAALARAIAHQQLNGIVANRIFERFRALYAPAEFPDPEALLATPAATLRGVGFSEAKVRALHDLAAKTRDGTVPDAAELHRLEDAVIIERLTQVRGIGRWTVEMMLIFHLGRPDVLPVDDFGVRNGFRLAYGLRHLPTPRALQEFGKCWKGARSSAAWYLWRAVDLARAQRLPVPPKPAPRLQQQRPKAARKKRAVRNPAGGRRRARK